MNEMTDWVRWKLTTPRPGNDPRHDTDGMGAWHLVRNFSGRGNASTMCQGLLSGADTEFAQGYPTHGIICTKCRRIAMEMPATTPVTAS
jgi:hypothetical protein